MVGSKLMVITKSCFFVMMGSNPMKDYIPYQVFVSCVENQNMNHIILCKTTQGTNDKAHEVW